MPLLRTALLLNASSCLLFGLVFLAFPAPVGQLIGSPDSGVIPVVGAALLFNGIHLVLASRRARPICREILYFIAGDALWVIGTVVLIGLGLMATSTEGRVAALAVAAMVGAFAVMQAAGYRRICTNA